MLVVDCSVAAKWVLTEPGEIDAFRLLDQQALGADRRIFRGASVGIRPSGYWLSF
jgi:hypothetical protein